MGVDLLRLINEIVSFKMELPGDMRDYYKHQVHHQ